MIQEEVKSDYALKLKRYLANPSAMKPLYEQFKKEEPNFSFSDYTSALEDLLEKLNTGKFENHGDFCKEIKHLQLPHNQFDCES